MPTCHFLSASSPGSLFSIFFQFTFSSDELFKQWSVRASSWSFHFQPFRLNYVSDAPPRISSISGTLFKKIGDRIELECKTVGVPKPIIQWIVNSSSKSSPQLILFLYPESHHHQTQDLLVSNTSSSDLSRSITTSPTSGHQVPPKSSSSTPDKRIQVMMNGSLRIESLSPTDEGNYSCQAKNIHGSSGVISYNLIVLNQNPSDSVAPFYPVLRVEEVTSKSIKIRVEARVSPSSNSASSVTIGPSINASSSPSTGLMMMSGLIQKIYFKNLQPNSEWKHYVINDQPGQSGHTPSSSSVNGSTFVIMNLLCGNRYQIYVVNLNRDGQSATSDVLLAKTAGREPLAPPVSIALYN